MIVRFHFHQDVGFIILKMIAAIRVRKKARDRGSLHDRGIVRVRNHGAAGCQSMGVADHGEQAFVLRLAVDHPRGIENLVAAVFGIGLREHHQFDVGGVARDALVVVEEVIDFIRRERQSHLGVCAAQRVPSLSHHRHARERRRRLCDE